MAQLGGDEFAVFIKSIDNESMDFLKVTVLLETLQREFSFDGIESEIKAVLGIALFPYHFYNYKDLIEKVNLVLYSSKEKSENLITLYNVDRKFKKIRNILLGENELSWKCIKTLAIS